MTVLLPTAAELRRALTRHAEAAGRDERHPTPGTARAREDSAYTLCVLTGTQGVGEAVRAAQTLLGGVPRRAPALVAALPAPVHATSGGSASGRAASGRAIPGRPSSSGRQMSGSARQVSERQMSGGPASGRPVAPVPAALGDAA